MLLLLLLLFKIVTQTFGSREKALCNDVSKNTSRDWVWVEPSLFVTINIRVIQLEVERELSMFPCKQKKNLAKQLPTCSLQENHSLFELYDAFTLSVKKSKATKKRFVLEAIKKSSQWSHNDAKYARLFEIIKKMFKKQWTWIQQILGFVRTWITVIVFTSNFLLYVVSIH